MSAFVHHLKITPPTTEEPHNTVPLYSAYNKDEEKRTKGSSGSVFLSLAECILLKGGYVVGAAFDEHLKLRHRIIDSVDAIEPLLKSKYVQSGTTGIFTKVKEKLLEGKQVVFCGTPCQCEAMRNYVGRLLQDNLLLVDFLCHGVPSQKLFEDFLRHFEKETKCNVINFQFRIKNDKGVHNCLIKYEKDDKEVEEVINYTEFPFYLAYKRYFIFRESCYSCPFARPNRSTDITIGDCWGLEKISNVQDFNKGYSLLQINNEKGKKWYDEVSDKLNVCVFKRSDAIANNHSYSKSTPKTAIHSLFKFAYAILPFEMVFYLFMRKQYSIIVRIINKLLSIW